MRPEIPVKACLRGVHVTRHGLSRRKLPAHSATARRLFHEVAKDQPIIDYHCHLSPREIATNHRWDNLAEIWLGGDHYKWRLMRANGVDEDLITGDSTPREKFQAWAETVPFTLRNPIHHWTHLELQRYFGIDLLLGPDTAEEIWERANAKLAEPDFCVHGILKNSMSASSAPPTIRRTRSTTTRRSPQVGLSTLVVPTFRPDKALLVDNRTFSAVARETRGITDIDIVHLSDLLAALQKRHDDFHAAGGRLSDHGLDRLPAAPVLRRGGGDDFRQRPRRKSRHPEEKEKVLVLPDGLLRPARRRARLDQAAPPRRLPQRQLAHVWKPRPGHRLRHHRRHPQGAALSPTSTPSPAREPAQDRALQPQPARQLPLRRLTGAFQDGTFPGKIQFGSGWWFLDQKNGMELQLDALSATGLLSRFVGMLTDSRSFLSSRATNTSAASSATSSAARPDRGELPDDFEGAEGGAAIGGIQP
jgi:glucuronate isomerase